MIIKTERLLLRPICENDINTVRRYACDEENTRYMLYFPKPEHELKRFLKDAALEWQKEQPRCFEFAIMLGEVHIGGISIEYLERPQKGELGWVIDKHYQNRGYVSEAAAALLELAKTKLDMKRVIAQCDWRNNASARVMEKIGMKLVDEKGTRTYAKTGETSRELTYMIEF